MKKLTDKAIQAARPRRIAYKLAGGEGLILLVQPNGSRLWRFRYRWQGREKLLSLGAYPAVSLKAARAKRDEMRRLLAAGIDPSAARRREKAAQANTFEAVAEEFMAGQAVRLSPTTITRDRQVLAKLIKPFGHRPIGSITALELLDELRRYQRAGKHSTAQRMRQLAGRIFRYAIPDGRATHDPAAALRDALIAPKPNHYAAVTEPAKLGEMLRAIDGYTGQPVTRAALLLLAMLFCRPSELRLSLWREVDLAAGQWLIPAGRTKGRREHIVPLSRQAVELLTDLARLTNRGPDSLVLPGLRPRRPMSANTCNAALRGLGYGPDVHVAHGFRSTASTLLHELGFEPRAIELQLAHSDTNEVRGIYNRAERLEERRRMMQSWSDYLDGLRTGADATPLRARKR